MIIGHGFGHVFLSTFVLKSATLATGADYALGLATGGLIAVAFWFLGNLSCMARQCASGDRVGGGGSGEDGGGVQRIHRNVDGDEYVGRPLVVTGPGWDFTTKYTGKPGAAGRESPVAGRSAHA